MFYIAKLFVRQKSDVDFNKSKFYTFRDKVYLLGVFQKNNF